MAKKIILGDEEYKVLCKALEAVPPAKAISIADIDGCEKYFYERVLTQILKKDYRFPKTDD